MAERRGQCLIDVSRAHSGAVPADAGLAGHHGRIVADAGEGDGKPVGSRS
jgi:hypothetical protein